VASKQTDDDDRADESHGPRECMPCRGTGKLISNLGGTPSTVACPWCDGGGVRVLGIDAQAKWPVNDTAEKPASESERTATE
jgi:DnaJ-class molecular chaperone